MKKQSSSTITAVIIAKNEENTLLTCLLGLKWCDHILVIDSNSSDKTAEVAEQYGAKVISFSHQSFSRMRNEALKHVNTDWIFYVDADERVLPLLAREIKLQVETNEYQAMSFYRKNICYGVEFKNGGWEKDLITRVFKTTSLKEWVGEVHESPSFEGEVIVLKTPLIHHTHRNTTDGLKKTIIWTKIEAKLLASSDIKPVSLSTILRKGIMEFIRRAILKKGYRDGVEGMIEAVVQGINKVLTYIQVWELQQTPLLDEQYKKRDLEFSKIWEKEEIK